VGVRARIRGRASKSSPKEKQPGGGRIFFGQILRHLAQKERLLQDRRVLWGGVCQHWAGPGSGEGVPKENSVTGFCPLTQPLVKTGDIWQEKKTNIPQGLCKRHLGGLGGSEKHLGGEKKSTDLCASSPGSGVWKGVRN